MWGGGKLRESGIETLKIIAMFLIVVSHVVQTLGTSNMHYPNDFVYSYEYASTNPQSLVLAWMRCLGTQGNLIFFICSAWFLLDSVKIDSKRIIRMIVDTWIINIISLVVIKSMIGYSVLGKDVIKSFFPITFSLNWYITFYIIFYSIHTMLNRLINGMSQKELLTGSFIALTLYYGVGYFLHAFFTNKLIQFVVVYFAVAYMKKYMKLFSKNKKKNILILVIGMIGTPIMILLTDAVGLYFGLFQDKLTRWARNDSPFFLLTAIACFNLLKGKHFTNRFINQISALSMLIYIIHENNLFGTYIRPQIWIYVYNNYGYSNAVGWALIISLCLFILSAGASYIYKISTQKIVFRVSDKLHDRMIILYSKIINRMMRIG